MSIKTNDEQDIIKNLANTDVVERATKSDFPNSSQKKNHGLTSAAEIKARVSLSALMARDGYKLTKSGEYLKCCCPFHKDRTPSFFIYANDSYARCYGCGWNGDVFDYEKKKRRTDFAGAMRNLERKASTVCRDVRFVSESRKKEKEELTQAQREIMTTAVQRLASDFTLCASVAKSRGWCAETILELAKEGSLGWHRGALAFNYDTGMKLRDWPDKRFAWEFGGNGLWRVQRITEAMHIYITEGETDCISLVNARVEDEPGYAVVCCPGASGFKNEWGKLFKSKTVTLCFDNDDAGRRGTKEVGTILQDYAKAVNIHELKEVA